MQVGCPEESTYFVSHPSRVGNGREVQDQEKGLFVFLVLLAGSQIQVEESDLGGEKGGVQHSRSHVEGTCQVSSFGGAGRRWWRQREGSARFGEEAGGYPVGD